jgi:hypothetical protein
MNSAIYAIVGIALAILLTVGLSKIDVPSGDPVIQPEGERDPGKHD